MPRGGMPVAAHHYPSHWDDRASRASSSVIDYSPEMREAPVYKSESRHSLHSNGYSVEESSVGGHADHHSYLLEHLATFTVTPDTGIVAPRDGMRRLLQMEKTTGIWTQKMRMRLDSSWVVILDNENGDLVERFPMHMVREPTAFTSNDPKEMYNNIFIFILSEDPEKLVHSISEMHIFQCVKVSAQQVVEDMKLCMSGKMGGRPLQIPPPPINPAPEPPVNGMSVRDQVSMFNSTSNHFETSRPPRLERNGSNGELGPRDGVSLNDDTSSTSSEKYERDVAILNHCFDDIEKFIARLQHAAAAARELERRRTSRKSKKKDMGDGMLSMRAKPPPRRDFIDIFQKFKLSFNLLAKLKAHIHDPNAPELVHFLFTPLALIVDAARDSNMGANLPGDVLSPLLTRDAIDLLINCLTSKESELWHSLGETWLVPRDQWKSYVPSYQPVFMDGWAPECSDEKERSNALGSAVASEAQRMRAEKIRAAEQEADLREQHYHRSSDHDGASDFFYDSDQRRDEPPSPSMESPSRRMYERRHERYAREERERTRTPSSERDFRPAHSDISADSIERLGGPAAFERQQRHFVEEVKGRGGKVVQVTYPRTANNDKELSVVRGEFLEVLDDSRKWWKARNFRGQVAHVPHTIVTPTTQDEVFSNPVYTAGHDAQDERDGRSPRTPPSNPSPAPADWVRKERQGKKESKLESGPSDLSEDEDGLPKPSCRRRGRGGGRKKKAPESTSTTSTLSSVPPPPPPLPPTITVTQPPLPPKPKKQLHPAQPLPATLSQQDLVNLELKSVLGTLRKSRLDLEIHRTPDAFIDQNSSVQSVQDWLVVKEFSDSARRVLRNMDGRAVFRLEREKMEKYIGKDEGSRLYSQIQIQRNISGYKTTSSAELSAMLARAREKAEGGEIQLPRELEELNYSAQHSDGESSEGSVVESGGTLKNQLKNQRRQLKKND